MLRRDGVVGLKDFISTPIGELRLEEAHTPLVYRRLFDFGKNIS
jgi:hypothetical protein